MQEFATELLLIVEDRERAELRMDDFLAQFRLAVVSADPGMWVRKMFPEWFIVTPERIEDADDVLSDSVGEWEFTESPGSEEAQQIVEKMIANGTGEITMADLE